jgi:signal transduction histidine kinase
MKSILPRTIQGRLVLSHLLVSLVSIVLISAYAAGVLYRAVRTQVENRYESLGFAAAHDLAQVFRDYPQGKAPETAFSSSLTRFFSGRPEVHINIYLTDGTPLLEVDGALPAFATPESDPELWKAIVSESGKSSQARKDDQGAEKLYLAFRIDDESQVYGVLRLDVFLDVALSEARRSLGLLVATALIVALGMGTVGYFLAHSLAGPIESITRAAESLTMGKLGVRVDAPAVPVEIFRLSQTFNLMASRVQSLVSELRSFVANASHELRTPLTSIKLRVEALRNGALEDPPVAERFLAEVESEVDRLSSMVNDLLDLSRIEAGLDASKRAPIELGSIVAEVYETFIVRAEKAGVSLSYQVEPALPAVLGSEDQLRRMMYNLVDNAIKYTNPGGRVELTLQADEQKRILRFMVEDTGYGIAPAQLSHVFDRFYRVEATRPRYSRSQGSGLGLPIAKSIAESHGGKIGVSSQVGIGSTFWVELPVTEDR